MAKNIGGRRLGAVRGRTQTQLPDGRWAKRNRSTGVIIAIKKDGQPFKGVIRERVAADLAIAPVLTFPSPSGLHADGDDRLADAA